MIRPILVAVLLLLTVSLSLASKTRTLVKDEDYWKNHRRHLQEELGHDLTLDKAESPRYGGIGLKCENPWGNPCGPDGICRNTKKGYSCKPIDGVFDDCASGCGPNTYCEQVSNVRKMCLCEDGYYRPDPHLPCIEDTQGVRRNRQRERKD